MYLGLGIDYSLPDSLGSLFAWAVPTAENLVEFFGFLPSLS